MTQVNWTFSPIIDEASLQSNFTTAVIIPDEFSVDSISKPHQYTIYHNPSFWPLDGPVLC